MATWHQQASPFKQLHHETQWTIVTDPPHRCRTLWREPSLPAAVHRLAVWIVNGAADTEHCHLLGPGGHGFVNHAQDTVRLEVRHIEEWRRKYPGAPCDFCKEGTCYSTPSKPAPGASSS